MLVGGKFIKIHNKITEKTKEEFGAVVR